MPIDMEIWQKRLKDAVAGLADADMQRRSWLGIGPEVSSPDEDFCQFLDDTSPEEFFSIRNTKINRQQRERGKRLVVLIRSELPGTVRQSIQPEILINDPRMIKVREAAKQLLDVL